MLQVLSVIRIGFKPMTCCLEGISLPKYRKKISLVLICYRFKFSYRVIFSMIINFNKKAVYFVKLIYRVFHCALLLNVFHLKRFQPVPRRMSLVKMRHSKISFRLACIYISSMVDLCRRKSKISGKKRF